MEQNDRKPKTVVLLIVIVGVLIALGFIGYRFFMVESVTIKGNSYYTSSEIAELAAIPRNTHIFTLDEATIKKNIEADPRVVVDSIDYVFPNGIEITVRERFPAAFVEFGGEDYILSNDLIVLDDEESDESVIPVLKGMGVQSASLGEVLEADDSYKVSVASGILTASLHNDVLKEYREIDLSDTNTVMLE